MNHTKWWAVLSIMIFLLLAIPVIGLPKEALEVEAQTNEPSCTDSDDGLNYSVLGHVEGILGNGWPYTLNDVCETGDREGFVREWWCSGTSPRPNFYDCPHGCGDGICLSGSCTDGDADGYAAEGGDCGPADCDDTNEAVNPGAAEICDNGVDDDCNGLTDAEDPACLVCTDGDGDGYAAEGGDCGPADCDDSNEAVNPGAAEICDNGVDDDCNGFTDAEDPACLVCTDGDGDGYAVEGGDCGPADCDDTNEAVNPGTAEICDNGIDDDCNSLIDADDPYCDFNQNFNVVIVGWDGVQRDHFWECYNSELPECADGLPNIQSLSNGVIFNNTTTNGFTETKPGWSQIFTGYNAEITGVISNQNYQPIPEGYSVFEKIENHLGADNVVTMFISSKGQQTGGNCDYGEPWCLVKSNLDYFELPPLIDTVVERGMQLLETHQDDRFFAFFLFADPDRTGHIDGENSAEYSEAIIQDDFRLGLIMDKLIELGILEKTLVYVLTDHGFDEGRTTHGNSPYGIFASNDPMVARCGDRKDIAVTFLERYGIDSGAIGSAPPVDGYSLYSMPYVCTPEGDPYIDGPGSPPCCSGLTVINLDRKLGSGWCMPAQGGTGDNSGYCTNCGNGVCESPEHRCNCPEDCP